MNKKIISIFILFSCFYTNTTLSSFWKNLFCCCSSDQNIKPRQTIANKNDQNDQTDIVTKKNQYQPTNQISNPTNLTQYQDQSKVIIIKYGLSHNYYHRNSLHFASNTSSPNNSSQKSPKTREETYVVDTINRH